MQTARIHEAGRPSAFVVGGVAALMNLLGWLLLTPRLDDQLGDAIIYAVPAVSLVVGVLLSFRMTSKRHGIAIIAGTLGAVGLALLGIAGAFVSGQLGE